MLERTTTTKALKWLNSQPHTRAIKISGTASQGAGHPDIIATAHGHTLAIEMKRPGHKPRPLQEWQLQQWKQAGALTATCTTLEEVQALHRAARPDGATDPPDPDSSHPAE